MTKRQFIDYISDRNHPSGQGKACDEGLIFVESCSSPQEAWEECPDAYFMTWYLERIGYDDVETWTRIACRCIRETKLEDGRTAWDLLTDERGRNVVETAERYIEGKATLEELRAATSAAGDAVEAATIATGDRTTFCK